MDKDYPIEKNILLEKEYDGVKYRVVKRDYPGRSSYIVEFAFKEDALGNLIWDSNLENISWMRDILLEDTITKLVGKLSRKDKGEVFPLWQCTARPLEPFTCVGLPNQYKKAKIQILSNEPLPGMNYVASDPGVWFDYSDIHHSDSEPDIISLGRYLFPEDGINFVLSIGFTR